MPCLNDNKMQCSILKTTLTGFNAIKVHQSYVNKTIHGLNLLLHSRLNVKKMLLLMWAKSLNIF